MMKQPNPSHDQLFQHWLLCLIMLILIIAYNVAAHLWGGEIQLKFDESQRIVIRSILYAISIILFPLVKLLRHILLRLNQTMPGSTPARQRYLLSIAVSLSVIEIVGVFGFIMFVLGDDFNTLYIFSLLAILGIFIHKPNLNEYFEILDSMQRQNTG